MNESTPIIASLWRRTFGGIIDLICLMIFSCLFIILTSLGSISTNDGFSVALNGWPFVSALVIYFTLLAMMEYNLGKTPGKYFTKTHVLHENFQPITFAQALLRNVARLIDIMACYLVGFIIILCTQQNQRFGDLIAKTIVVQDNIGEKT